MKIKLIPALITLLVLIQGCLQPPVGTPAPTPAETHAAVPTPAPTPTPTPMITPMPGQPVKYIFWIDSDFGFYRVRAVQGNTSISLPPDFDVLNFTINAGDRVKWMNDDSYDFPLTIVSNEGLWTGRTGLMRYQGERFEYEFNRTGIYTFSIREYPRIPNQKTIVK